MQLGRSILTNLFRIKIGARLHDFQKHLRKLPNPINEENGVKNISGRYFFGSVSSHRLVILSAVGLVGAAVYLKRNAAQEVYCEAVGKDGIISDKRPSCCYDEAIKKSTVLLERIMKENNCPAVTITVSLDGKEVWSEGMGLADVENNVPCTRKSVFRIASISKSITMAAVAKLVEDGKLDLDLSVQHYVSEWPEKLFDGQKVEITTRQLVSMLGGIRHYDKDCRSDELAAKKQLKKKKKAEFSHSEYYLNRAFGSVSESLDLFKQDSLCSIPGTKFLYSTHTWTLVSAVVEKVSGKKFEAVLIDLIREFNLKNTFLDENCPLIPNRARYYSINGNGKLQNAAPVDNSYKWAGGGLQATSSDLCKFGNIMLACYQGLNYKTQEDDRTFPHTVAVSRSNQATEQNLAKKPFLNQDTMKMMWTPVKNTKCTWDRDGFYAMGWCSVPTRPPAVAHAKQGDRIDFRRQQYFSHTGGAIGASSVLLVMPRYDADEAGKRGSISKMGGQVEEMPQGAVVAIITNMQQVGLNASALEIAAIFETARETSH